MTPLHILGIVLLAAVIIGVVWLNIWSRKNRADPDPIEDEWDSAVK